MRAHRALWAWQDRRHRATTRRSRSVIRAGRLREWRRWLVDLGKWLSRLRRLDLYDLAKHRCEEAEQFPLGHLVFLRGHRLGEDPRMVLASTPHTISVGPNRISGDPVHPHGRDGHRVV